MKGGKDETNLGLRGLAWDYLHSYTLEELEINRQRLKDRVKEPVKAYIEETWRPKEERVILAYTNQFFNLDIHASQRSESYHVVLKEMTNGQLSLEASVSTLIQKVLRVVDTIEREREDDVTSYPRSCQSNAFRNLRTNVFSCALRMVGKEWAELSKIAPRQLSELGLCYCSLITQWGLPCRHYLYRYYASGEPLPRSLCHPRWWLDRGPITQLNWEPYDAAEPLMNLSSKPLITTNTEQQLQSIRAELNPENQHRFDEQRERLERELIAASSEQLRRQELPFYAPEPIPKKTWRKARSGRTLTANELGERRQRSEAQLTRERERIAREDEITVTTETKTPSPIPETPPRSIPLVIRTPTTIERPRPRPRPVLSPESPYLPLSEYDLPASTAPPRLGREKRKRNHTAKYLESRAQGEIGESQEVHKAERRG